MNSLIENRLATLKAEGISPVAAIKAIHIEFSLSLAEAKRAFASSPAWHMEAQNGDELHEEIIKSLEALK